MTLRVVSETDPVALAWAAYDTAMLRLTRLYAWPASGASSREERLKQALEARDAWHAFIELYDQPENPRPAA